VLVVVGLIVGVAFLSAYQRTSSRDVVSGPNGSERPLLERLRHPDRALPNYLLTISFVLPIGISFIGLIVVAFQIITSTFFGQVSWIMKPLDLIVSIVLQVLVPAIVLSFLGMYFLRGYVLLKLRRRI
jgi:hypothetical protein